MTNDNPFQSPKENDRKLKISDPQKGIRWWIIPLSFLFALGVIETIMGLAMFAMMTITSMTGEPLMQPGPQGFDRDGIVVSTIAILNGVVMLLTSRRFYLGKWKTGLLLLALLVAANYIAIETSLMPGG